VSIWSSFRSRRLGERPALEQHRRFGYRPQLDGVRAIAILSVVGFHAWVFPRGGYLGVDMFFVLSGFLITTLLVEEAEANGRISLPHFYFRRALRLVPALVVAASVYALYIAAEVAITGHSRSGVPVENAVLGSLYGVLYVQNILIVTGHGMPLAVGHLWSLATEEQFYLVWPLTLFLALRAGATRRGLMLGLVAAIAVLEIDRFRLMLQHASFQRIYFAPDGQFDVILIGCVAGLWFAGGGATRMLGRPASNYAATLVGVAAVVFMLILPYYADWRVVLSVLPLLGAGVALLILALVVGRPSPLARLLSLPPLVFVGKISYALYLWHPILIWGFRRLPTVAEVALAFLVATLSYYVVELPFLRRKRRDRAEIDTRRRQAVPGLDVRSGRDAVGEPGAEAPRA
jgi:peptidoglycan/LPS O-acetylase OafA/YrhL